MAVAHQRLVRLGASALLALGAACAATVQLPGQNSSAEELPSERKVLFSCRGEFDERPITALFFNQAHAEVILLFEDGRAGAVRLPQQRSASGARYGDGVESFWIKGDTATYTRGGAYQCKVIPPPR